MSPEPRRLDQSQTEWTVYINESLKRMPVDEQKIWEKRCVYKVPACVTDLNKKAYQPQAVSFGPYHHGEDRLHPMEEHKHRALLHFLKRSGKRLEPFLESLREVARDLEESYEALDPKWKEGGSEGAGRFLELMITDGCFMLEILKMGTEVVDGYAPNDPIFSNHGKLYIMPYIRRDMLMLENQLPMLVLYRLVTVESDGKKDDEFVNKLILKFCSTGARIAKLGKCLHVLDVFRKSMLTEPKKKVRHEHVKMGHDGSEEIIRSATELDEAGIRFKKSKTDSLKDISFSKGVLRLPMIVVDDTTESMFLNLIAFERFHVGAGNEVTSYIFFMDNIIDNERDVALLHARGIIQNAIGSDRAVAKLFNSLSKDVTLEPDSTLDAVHKKVSRYCKKPWNVWRSNLIHTYFRNPWAILSLIAAIFLFALTIIQTVYAVLSYDG
ncbi:Glycerophosphodiester phosphodiesterase [Psidium guajava]|nr:Glycerophosphodiester phosphodiesterase [Psidium guajava]